MSNKYVQLLIEKNKTNTCTTKIHPLTSENIYIFQQVDL